MRCNDHDDVELRKAWLQVGGHVAAADALTDEERGALSLAAAGPDISADEAGALIAQGAASTVLSDEVVTRISESDIAFRLDCLLDVFRAVSTDGMSGTEWSRFCDVCTRILGGQHVDDVVKLCVLMTTMGETRSRIVLS